MEPQHSHHTPQPELAHDLHSGTSGHPDDHAGQHNPSATRLAVSATVHCLTGCAIGEILGLVLGTWWGWSNAATIVLAIALAFFFGYTLSVAPLLRGALSFRKALGIALAADTISIATMEI